MKINFKIAARRTKMIFKPKMTNDAEMITKRLQLAIKLVKVAKIWAGIPDICAEYTRKLSENCVCDRWTK